jgi:uncharacterized membrane protein YhhN
MWLVITEGLILQKLYAPEPWSAPLSDPSGAILLAWLACRSRSLLAARCLVEAVLSCYLSGTSFTEVSCFGRWVADSSS